MSQRLLLAIADTEVASRAAALVGEGEEVEVVGTATEPDEVTRALTRLDVDVVLLHDADHYGSVGSWRSTAAAIPRILDTLASDGLRAGPVTTAAQTAPATAGRSGRPRPA